MKKYDKILTVILLILDAIYFVLIKELPPKAAKYPMFVCVLLAILTIILGIQTFFTKEESNIEIFKEFKCKQFFFVIIISAIYIFVIDILGFFITTFIYLILCMVGLKAKILYSILTSIGFCILIYLVFVTFLKVPVPTGFLI